MKTPIVLFVLFWTGLGQAASINCEVAGDGNVIVTMKTPHPNHALIYRPDGEVVWLQTDPEYLHKQIPNFSELGTWVITPEAEGTVYIDGEATVQKIIKGKGKYDLYIAKNLETEPENTYFIECNFVIGEK